VSGAAAAAEQPDSSRGPFLLSIGEVLARLREDFPDVTISKLRFLEAEGLVEPQRTSAGYRKYSHADVDRLGYVLAAQRDRFLPLRVIRDHLAALDRGEVTTVADYRLTDESSVRRAVLTSIGDPFTESLHHSHGAEERGVDGDEDGDNVLSSVYRDDLLARTGLTDATLTELEDAGLVTTRNPGWYDADALLIATAAARLAQHGIGVRHLRAYRGTADREAGLFAALVAPYAKSASPSARARASDTVRELTTLSHQLHAALVRVSLRNTLGL
jgi:DNA-binding transcriptional MerR regulator